jgi:hypothetical protein
MAVLYIAIPKSLHHGAVLTFVVTNGVAGMYALAMVSLMITRYRSGRRAAV